MMQSQEAVLPILTSWIWATIKHGFGQLLSMDLGKNVNLYIKKRNVKSKNKQYKTSSKNVFYD